MRHTLRLVLVSALCSTAFLGARAQNVAINPDGAAPNVRAILDVDVTNLAPPKKGMLIPRMTYAQRLAIAPMVATDEGLWVYQTDDPVPADLTTAAALAHGYWYYDGAVWVRWSVGNFSWKLTGNANTNPANNFLGTAAGTNEDVYIRTTNNLVTNPVMRINGGAVNPGFVGVNLAAAPVERLEVSGGVKVANTALNTAGSIKFDVAATTPNRWHYGNITGTAAGWHRMENAEVLYTNETYCPILNQCLGLDGIAIRGTYDGTPVAGNPNTPFATNTGSNNRRGHRVQYLYSQAVLQAAGLCAGNITKISFYALGNDQGITNGPDGLPGTVDDVPGADIRVDIRMGNGGPADFGPYVASSLAATAIPWDAATEASANIHTLSAVSILTQNGWMDFQLTGAGFNYTGGALVIDVSWVRSATNGNSPQVQLEEGLVTTATKWVQVLSGSDINHGNTYQDIPLTLNASNGTTLNRPVTRFYGKVQTPGYGAATTDNFINYPGGLIVDSATISPGIWADANYRGPGTIRARVAVYDGSTQLSDHVFDRYYDDEVRPEDAKSAQGYAYVGLPALKEYLETERHLPNMPSREEWDAHGTRSLGEVQTGLWETVETQALHIIELEQDLSTLESMAFVKEASAAEMEEMIAGVNRSPRLTEQQKLHIIDALQRRVRTNTENTK